MTCLDEEEPVSRQKVRIEIPSCVHLLDEQLWQGNGVHVRSLGIMPVLIER